MSFAPVSTVLEPIDLSVTIPEYLEQHPQTVVSLLHLDFVRVPCHARFLHRRNGWNHGRGGWCSSHTPGLVIEQSATGALECVAAHPQFKIEEPMFLFNESQIAERVTYWPSAFLKRMSV